MPRFGGTQPDARIPMYTPDFAGSDSRIMPPCQAIKSALVGLGDSGQ